MEILLNFKVEEKTRCLMFGLVSEVLTAHLLGERFARVDVLSGVKREVSPLIRGPVRMDGSSAKLCSAAGYAGQKLLYRLSASEVTGPHRGEKRKWLEDRLLALLQESSKEYFDTYKTLDRRFLLSISPLAKRRFNELASALEVELLPLSELITSIAGKILALRGIANWTQISEIIASQIKKLDALQEVEVYKATVLRIKWNSMQVHLK